MILDRVCNTNLPEYPLMGQLQKGAPRWMMLLVLGSDHTEAMVDMVFYISHGLVSTPISIKSYSILKATTSINQLKLAIIYWLNRMGIVWLKIAAS